MPAIAPKASLREEGYDYQTGHPTPAENRTGDAAHKG